MEYLADKMGRHIAEDGWATGEDGTELQNAGKVFTGRIDSDRALLSIDEMPNGDLSPLTMWGDGEEQNERR